MNVAVGGSALQGGGGSAGGSDRNVAIGYTALQSLNGSVGNNVAIGWEASKDMTTGEQNVHIGWQAGENITTSRNTVLIGPNTGHSAGSYNIGIGYNVLASNTGQFNVAIGHSIMEQGTTATYNVAVGQALNGIRTGDYNVALGEQAMGNISGSSSYNVAVGSNAQRYSGYETGVESPYNVGIGADAGMHASASYNTFVGGFAGKGGTTSAPYSSGQSNTAIGYQALTGFTTGGNNIAIGKDSGKLITTAGTNVVIGRDAGDDIVGGGSNICIGYQARAGHASRNNAIVIGQSISAGGDNDFSFGKASNVVTNDFDADADWSRSSDARLKRNVQDTSLGLDFVNDLRPVKFQWKPSNEVPKELTSEYNEENQKNLDYVSHGFIAQEVKEVVDKHGDSSFGVWQLDGDGETQRIKKNMLVMPLIKAVQELSEKVESQQKEIEELKNR